MVNGIEELNFPAYATLSSATVTLQDMGDKSIAAQVRIDGNIAPDFSADWEVVFKGERYIMPLREPQAAKGNTSLDSEIDLTFQHWAIYQLKRWPFVTIEPTESGTAVADKYIASVSLNLLDFIELMKRVLNHYFGDAITIELSSDAAAKAKKESTTVEISYSYVWDVLLKLYELYGVRWQIEPNGDSQHYIIKVGYGAESINHIFEYGFEGGLLKIERQVQDSNIRNMLLGRGGSRNLPYRYFKDVDPQNPTFPADPDWIPELRNIYFTELRSKEFRDYVRGWKTNPRRQLTEANGTPIYPYGSSSKLMVETYDTTEAEWNVAYAKGHSDVKFDPSEFVEDAASIKRYGPLVGGLGNNDEIYPSIQDRSIIGLGRIDEAVDIEQIKDDSIIVESARNEAKTTNLMPADGGKATTTLSPSEMNTNNNKATVILRGGNFTVSPGMTANLIAEGVAGNISITYLGETRVLGDEYFEVTGYKTVVRDSFNKEQPSVGLVEGVYSYWVEVTILFKGVLENRSIVYNFNASFAGAKLTQAIVAGNAGNGRTFDVWIKNVWDTQKRGAESEAAYVERVWRPILGDRDGNEAKVTFVSGWLSTSTDYEFTIVKGGVHFDESKSLNGVKSHWRLTLARSEADLESTGLYVPSPVKQGKPGDLFLFTGIELPHRYILLAEQALQDYKLEELGKVSEISPTWVVTTDRVRLNNEGRAGALIDELKIGCGIRLADKRFILNREADVPTPAAYETLYLQSITYTFREPTDDDAALNPDVELVLGRDYVVTASPVAALQSSVNTLHQQVGSLGNIEQLIRAVGDKVYLRKDGLSDRSVSPTEFANLLTSYGFRQGMVGGKGWGFYRDANGDWVLEIDRLKARLDFEVNTLVANQIEARWGMIVESAAAMEITSVEQTENGNFRCYFDQKGGTMQNGFKVGDVAWCNRFQPIGNVSAPAGDSLLDASEKFYRRRVMECHEDSVVLSGGYNAVAMPDGTTDTGVNGRGIPAEGDIIVQRGSYTDARRRFMIVRDVVGGGYERFIEDLDSVNSEGAEYYFVGRQQGMYGGKPRFFIGNDANFIEFLNGKLRIKAELSVESTFGGKTLPELVTEEIIQDQTRNHALTTSLPFSVSDFTTTSQTYNLYAIEGVSGGDYITVGFDYDIIDVDFNSGADIYIQFYINGSYITPTKEYHLPLVAGRDRHHSFTYQIPASIGASTNDSKDAVRLRINNCVGGTINIRKFMLQRSKKESPWSANPNDPNYLVKALQGSTTISGGLTLTSTIMVGENQNGWIVRAGMNGTEDSAHPNGGVVFWGGGTYEQAANGSSTYVVYMDGTGHAAGGTIKFTENALQVGEYINLNDGGLDMTIGGARKMRIGNYAIENATYVMNAALSYNLGRYLKKSLATKRPKSSSAYSLWISGISTSSTSPTVEKFKLGSGYLPKGAKVTLKPFTIGIDSSIPVEFTSLNTAAIPAIAIHLYNGSARIGTFGQPTPRMDSSRDIAYTFPERTLELTRNYDDLNIRVMVWNRITEPLGDAWVSGGDMNIDSGAADIEATATLPTYDETLLGSDGLQFSWGNCHQYQKNNFWGVRTGVHGLQITNEDIRILEPKTNGEWFGLRRWVEMVIGEYLKTKGIS